MSQSPRPGGSPSQREAVTVSQTSTLLTGAIYFCGRCAGLCCVDGLFSFQGPGPMGGPWSQECLGCSCGSPHPRKNPGSRPLEARAFHRSRGRGYHPKLTFPVEACPAGSRCPTICTEPASEGWAPQRAALLHHPPVLFG